MSIVFHSEMTTLSIQTNNNKEMEISNQFQAMKLKQIFVWLHDTLDLISNLQKSWGLIRKMILMLEGGLIFHA